jgi:hypothetical protein
MGSRPDMVYAVTLLGRFSKDPSNTHWNAVKHLLRYLKAMLDTKLPLIRSVPGKEYLVGFADADHAGDTVASKSTSGFLIYAHNILVLWKSKKQRLVAQSTMEAELVATTEAWKNLQWIGDMLSELGHITTPREASLIYNDNESAVQVLSTGNFSTDSRHMRLRFHHLVDCIAKQQLSIRHISTNDMWADGLTKPLGGNKHREFLQVLGMRDGTIGGMVDGTVAGGVLGRRA